VFVDKRTALRGMTLEAGIVSAKERDATTVDRLRHIGGGAFDRQPDMRVVAIGTTDFAFQHRVMMRQLELSADFEVTLEAGLRIFARIDDRACAAAGGNVFTTRTVA
jgi:hypothetical protein